MKYREYYLACRTNSEPCKSQADRDMDEIEDAREEFNGDGQIAWAADLARYGQYNEGMKIHQD